ncbi:MAG: hypothetical protein KDJ86_19490 [Bauldia sp.]|uniref:hypothetical protein n=1 Tax=Bauldia sp. TaxID=2575872 RepID=UPI001DEE1F74|nr:hypothetical protein [Bauldia sp.]MCB1497977.1 hypothetical protein [Bauldia sp.]
MDEAKASRQDANGGRLGKIAAIARSGVRCEDRERGDRQSMTWLQFLAVMFGPALVLAIVAAIILATSRRSQT